MSDSIWRLLVRATAALLVTVPLVAGCACAEDDPSSSQSSAEQWHERSTPDAMTATPPEGWIILDPEAGETYENFTIARAAPSWENVPGISAYNDPPDRVLGLYHLPRPDFDLEAHLKQAMTDREKTGQVKDTRLLDPRMIDGSSAWGYEGIFTFNDSVDYPSQCWEVWREDGLWTIYVTGDPGTTTVPVELINVLDSVEWSPMP
ncbi:hypothetical protein [Actinomyces mediterranea]|uniref:hypothetical protein n=1 Tax=Actinomyces mediterranea TaxID=1871028 RepID=UPI00097056AB|nr:hypothetical protein [Actinomyces mediterranea]